MENGKHFLSKKWQLKESVMQLLIIAIALIPTVVVLYFIGFQYPIYGVIFLVLLILTFSIALPYFLSRKDNYAYYVLSDDSISVPLWLNSDLQRIIKYGSITKVNLQQSFLDKIFGLGDIQIYHDKIPDFYRIKNINIFISFLTPRLLIQPSVYSDDFCHLIGLEKKDADSLLKFLNEKSKDKTVEKGVNSSRSIESIDQQFNPNISKKIALLIIVGILISPLVIFFLVDLFDSVFK